MNTTPCALAAIMRLRGQARGLKRVAIAEGVLNILLLLWIARSWLW
jgi:hypothetical protein